MRKVIKIDPITRIEGHMAVDVVVDDGVVKDAKSQGTLFRGFEMILKGRDPRDASRYTQRICGVCPAAHSTASALCLDDAFGIKDKIPKNARIIRALILGSNFLQSHILHFYHLAALDYVDAAAAVGNLSPFVPRYEGDYRASGQINAELVNHYIKALDIRRKCHEMLTIFGGKMPHNVGIVAGGVTDKPTEDKITSFLWRLNEIRDFIDNIYIPDVIAVAKTYDDYFAIGRGCGNFLSYGGLYSDNGPLLPSGTTSENLKFEQFDAAQITEDVKNSWYADSTSGKNPAFSDTEPDLNKKQAYSFIKAPRYKGKVVETGPLARAVVAYAKGDKNIKAAVDPLLSEFGADASALFSVLGRHAARALEAKLIADAMADWLMALKPNDPFIADYDIPEQADGTGLSAAPRGAVGHWTNIKNKKINRYQVITPTAWNCSPKDDNGQPGPVEQSLIGTKVKDTENPFEIVRIVRAFDPCLACSIHLLDAKCTELGVFRVV